MISLQRRKARQTGLLLGLVFVIVDLRHWLLVSAGVVFAVVTFVGGGRVFSFFVLVQVIQRISAGPAICHGARGARTRAAADAILNNRERRGVEDRGIAAAIDAHKPRVRQRRVRLHYAPNARVGALDANMRSLGNLILPAHTVTWRDRNRLSSNLDRHLEFALTFALLKCMAARSV